MTLAFPEEEWRHVTPAQIDCFGEYVEPQACGVSSPGKTICREETGILEATTLSQISEPGATVKGRGFMADK